LDVKNELFYIIFEFHKLKYLLGSISLLSLYKSYESLSNFSLIMIISTLVKKEKFSLIKVQPTDGGLNHLATFQCEKIYIHIIY